MSSASLLEKRSSKTIRSHRIDSSSPITSAPTSTSCTLRYKTQSSNRMREQNRSKQRNNSSLEKSRGSNYELSSSDANENFHSTKKLNKYSSAADVKNADSDKHSDSNLDQLQQDLLQVSKLRIQAEKDLKELKHQYHDFQSKVDKERQNPLSEYDDLISKQQNFNESMENQISDAKEKLKNLTQSLKTIRICGKECDIHIRDLIIDYDCITKGELAKEIKRFQRMEIDLKNTLDRLHWRMDCETKMYQNFVDQFHKLQMDLYYLKNI